MKKTFITISLLIALFLPPSISFAAGGGHDKNVLNENPSGLKFLPYPEALQKASDEDKLLMVFFWAEWCRYCIQMRDEVFTLDEVKEAFDKSYVAVSVNIENDFENITSQFRPKSLPTMAFLRPNGDLLGTLPGALDAENLIKILALIIEDSKKD